MYNPPEGTTHVEYTHTGYHTYIYFKEIKKKVFKWYHPGWRSWEDANMYNTPLHLLWRLK